MQLVFPNIGLVVWAKLCVVGLSRLRIAAGRSLPTSGGRCRLHTLTQPDQTFPADLVHIPVLLVPNSPSHSHSHSHAHSVFVCELRSGPFSACPTTVIACHSLPGFHPGEIAFSRLESFPTSSCDTAALLERIAYFVGRAVSQSSCAEFVFGDKVSPSTSFSFVSPTV